MGLKRKEYISTLNENVGDLKKDICNLIGLIEKDNEKEALSLLPSIIENLDFLLNLITSTKQDADDYIEKLNINGTLNNVIEALNNEDYFLVSDLFKYEVLFEIDNIQDEIKNCIEADDIL